MLTTISLIVGILVGLATFINLTLKNVKLILDIIDWIINHQK
ncbi:hypothetical protein [Ligilactobacillus agilis]|nr:hypothetical protein [Ligilactobacillus agilis]